MMKSRLRIYATYCLLLLLPLQSIAAMKVYACAIAMVKMNTVTMVMAEPMPDCKLYKAKIISQTHAQHASVAEKHDAAPCKMLTVCNAIVLIATLPRTQHIAINLGNEPLSIFTPSVYRSFIADGLQRPPNFFA
jgi:hypothetical protein